MITIKTQLVAEIIEQLAENESITIRDVDDVVDCSRGTVSATFRELRHLEWVEMQGQKGGAEYVRGPRFDAIFGEE